MKKCKFCKSETKNDICHECSILISKRKFSEKEMFSYINIKKNGLYLNEYKLEKYYPGNFKVSFKCKSCNSEVSGNWKNHKNNKELLCSKCRLKSNLNEKYGVDNVFQLEEIKNKIKKVNIEKYGCECYLQTKEARDKRRNFSVENLKNKVHKKLDSYCNNIEFESDSNIRLKNDDGSLYYQKLKCTCKCGHIYETNVRIQQRCPKCFKQDWMNGTSLLENEIYEYCVSIYDGDIIRNDRKILEGKELDLYFPELSLAVEIDGDFWHGFHSLDMSLFNVMKNSADEKKVKCQDKGIRLITIKECDYRDRPDVFKRFLKNNILPKEKIFARKCEFRTIENNEYKSFLEKYHVNGYRPAKEKYGLFYNNELVCVAGFSKHVKYDYECIRLAFKTGIQIVGGWNKIIKNFGRRFLHYVNLQYFPGENKTGVGYRFSKNGIILSRNTMQKNTRLLKYCENYNKDLNDIQNAVENGFNVIFDNGNDIQIKSLN